MFFTFLDRKIPFKKLDFVNAAPELRKVNRLCDRKQAFVDAVGTFRGRFILSLPVKNIRWPSRPEQQESQKIQLEWMQNCDA